MNNDNSEAGDGWIKNIKNWKQVLTVSFVLAVVPISLSNNSDQYKIIVNAMIIGTIIVVFVVNSVLDNKKWKEKLENQLAILANFEAYQDIIEDLERRIRNIPIAIELR